MRVDPALKGLLAVAAPENEKKRPKEPSGKRIGLLSISGAGRHRELGMMDRRRHIGERHAA
jgi:hypothetical protein